MKFNINFDLDGVAVDLYTVPEWLEKLKAEDASPYLEAKPLLNLSLLARYLNKLQKMGYQINVISWTSKNSSIAYHEAVQQAKMKWLAEHLPSVHFDQINIVPYGTPKQNYRRSPLDILFDDELPNRENWGNDRAYPETAIFDVLKELVRGE